MTNTKFRKRALLSSVAMLLVALVALGSATFAWFSADPNAHTTGLQLKANSSTGLVIQSETEKSKDEDHWTHTAMFNTASINDSGVSQPGAAVPIGAASQDASTGTNKGIYRVDAEKENDYKPATAAAVTAAGKGSDYYEEKLYLKVTGATSSNVNLKSVAISNKTTDLAKAIRVAILKEDGTCLGIWKPAGSADNKYLMKAGAYNEEGVLSSAAYTGKAAGAVSPAISVGTVNDQGGNYITVRVYLDGEDNKVFSTGIASADLSSVITGLVIDLKAE